ncbi:MAG: hypothetical protein V4739_04260 [Pseudomonadota bacterium]
MMKLTPSTAHRCLLALAVAGLTTLGACDRREDTATPRTDTPTQSPGAGPRTGTDGGAATPNAGTGGNSGTGMGTGSTGTGSSTGAPAGTSSMGGSESAAGSASAPASR